MIETPDLIDALVTDAGPVRLLRPPVLRAALWLTLPVLIFGLLALAHGLRPDLGAKLQQLDFGTAVAASVLTGVLATVAAFMLNLPGRSAYWGLLPVPALAVWVASIGQSCLTNWIAIGPDGMQAGETARCFVTVLLTSLPLSVALLTMLHHGAALRPSLLAVMAGLAIAGITATAVMIFHSIDASVIVLMWNFGTTALIVGLGAAFGRRVLGD